MELFLIIVVILFILAISDLIVGVSNDAVNFLNSAIGSKVAPRHIIMIVASLGIMAGTIFSGGLMEVARKGIFNPDMFYFQDIMMIFLAVMLTDVLLLDLFNTFGLPTSTTVSIVFELLGAAVALSLIKVIEADQVVTQIVTYINTSQAFAIISGILLSVVIAFTAGAIIQYIIRLIFTFEFEKRVSRYGAIFAAATITAITLFILFKGAKGAAFIPAEFVGWIKDNVYLALLYSLIFWSVIFQLLLWFTKIDILKPLVLTGTFALALAFAANDLVNFIGVPLAGLSSYQVATGLDDPFSHLMVELTQKVDTPTLLLLLAGVVMVVTLWFNKKARTVTKTEVNLGRQEEGYERFESSLVARGVVRMNLAALGLVKKVLPNSLLSYINSRFDISKAQIKKMNKADAPAFDLLRATVNLMVASILISFATSLKLPLSTTYVTFMVAMGTSLSDRAWGRESAVYRVNGVFTVIGGWFLTAVLAFTFGGIFVTLIYFGELIAIIILISLAGVMIFRTHVLHKKREEEEESAIQKLTMAGATTGTESMAALFSDITRYMTSVIKQIKIDLDGLLNSDRTALSAESKNVKKLKKHANSIISQIIQSVQMLNESEVKQGRRYGKIISSIQEIQANTREFHDHCMIHLDNHHKAPGEEEFNDLNKLFDAMCNLIKVANDILDNKKFEKIDEFNQKHQAIQELFQLLDESALLRIKHGRVTSRNSMLFINLISNLENISTQVGYLVALCRKNYNRIAAINTPKDID
jgi:phosphate/sulfate permease